MSTTHTHTHIRKKKKQKSSNRLYCSMLTSSFIALVSIPLPFSPPPLFSFISFGSAFLLLGLPRSFIFFSVPLFPSLSGFPLSRGVSSLGLIHTFSFPLASKSSQENWKRWRRRRRSAEDYWMSRCWGESKMNKSRHKELQLLGCFARFDVWFSRYKRRGNMAASYQTIAFFLTTGQLLRISFASVCSGM